MKFFRRAAFAIAMLAFYAAPEPVRAQTILSVDARAAAPAPETGYLHFGANASPTGGVVAVNNQYLSIDGHPWLPVMGEFHYTRFPQQYWEEELLKMKAAGVSIVSTYIFWNQHEETEGRFNWSGDRDLRRFVTLCGQLGLKVFIRPGPWVHSESRFGGIPDWVVQAMPTRSNDPTYLRYVARYFGEVDRQVRGLLWKDGGPIIGLQLENEYHPGNAEQGRQHIVTLKRIAMEAGLDVPLYTVTGWDGAVFPSGEVAPVFGGYADWPWGITTQILPPAETYAFRFDSRVRGDAGEMGPNAARGDADADAMHTPFLGAEFGGGLPSMYRRRPIMTPDDVASMLPIQLGSGVNLYGYYMFHGGRIAPGPSFQEENTSIGAYNDLPLIDYDFQAPIGGYGQQHPVMNKIRPLHYFLQAFGADLAPMTVRRPAMVSRNSADLETPRFSVRSRGDSGFLFVSNYVRQYQMATQRGVQFAVQLPHGTVTFPSQPIDVPSGAYFIWPINMDLAGAQLIYATAQPITRIDAGGTPVYVFRAVEGIAPEFAVGESGVASVRAQSGRVAHSAGRYIVSGMRSGTNATIDIQTAAGGSARILLLSASQGEQAWVGNLEGRPHLVLSDAQLTFDAGGLTLYSVGAPRFRAAIFPALANTPTGDTRLSSGRDGIFQVLQASARNRAIRAGFTQIRNAGAVPPLAMTGPNNTAVEPAPEVFGQSAAWTITVPADALNGLDDAYLRIRARGDVARLFSGTTMIDDHFLDGSVWEVGLKRFANEIRGPLTLTILPMRKDAPIYLDRGVTAMVDGDQTAEIVDVSVAPQYRLRIAVAGGETHAH